MEVLALSGLEGRAGQECSGRGVPADRRVVVPRTREQVVLVGLGVAWSPPLWVQGGPQQHSCLDYTVPSWKGVNLWNPVLPVTSSLPTCSSD